MLPAHVVLLTNFIPPHQRPLFEELSRRVERLTILISTPMETDRPWTADWGALDVRVLRTWTVRRPWRHPSGFSDRLHVHVPLNALGALRRLRPDVVLSSALGFSTAAAAAYKSMCGVPLLVWVGLSEHTERGRGLARRWLRRRLVGSIDRILVNGESGARYLRQLGFAESRIARVPYTTEPGLWDRGPLTRGVDAAHRLLYVGQLNERKGILPFVEKLAAWAASHLERRIEFSIIGSGPLRERLAAIEKPANLQLELSGERSFQQIAAAYAAAGILVFPTLADEWGMVVNEALAAGLPVLGSEYSQAAAELCDEGETGWLFRPDSPGDAEGALERAFNTSAERLNEMRVAARARVAPITPERSAERMVEAIELVLERKRGGA
ncbi:MAG TPA: glycosyltransferase family 4 protein [Pirellulales bacterium]|nr:glycosyltransferase family 4 protein [Pirellulales bacterium]